MKEAKKHFHCQRKEEGHRKCKTQCDHCKEYYYPLDNPNGKFYQESCNHNRKKLPYLAWMDWAEKLYQKGIEQTQCPKCKLWLFPEELKKKKKKKKRSWYKEREKKALEKFIQDQMNFNFWLRWGCLPGKETKKSRLNKIDSPDLKKRDIRKNPYDVT